MILRLVIAGRTGRAGKQGNAILLYTSSQRRTVRSLERDVGSKFEFVSAPAMEEVLESSAAQVVATLEFILSLFSFFPQLLKTD